MSFVVAVFRIRPAGSATKAARCKVLMHFVAHAAVAIDTCCNEVFILKLDTGENFISIHSEP